VFDRTSMITWVAASVLVLTSPVQAQKSVMTADDVIASSMASRGGLARVEAVRTEKLRGHISFSSGSQHPFAVDLARPNRIRTVITLDGGQIVQAYDGKIAWAINPVQFPDDTTPHLLPAGEAENVAAGGDMDGPLIHYAAKGNHVTYAGIDTADGRAAYKLDVVTASGLRDTYYVDTTSHLQTKWQGHRVMNGAPVVFESFFRDYRPVDGVMFAFRIDSGTEGQAGGQSIRLDTVELNAPMPDQQFAMPPAAAAAKATP
jgi:hypothetical protein